jgi:hypothetical protein
MALKNAKGGKAGGRTTYRNLKDLELLEKKHNQKSEERFKRIEDMIVKEAANNKKENAKDRIRIVNLENRVNVLTLASKGYREIRHRFLNVYRRDILGKVGPQGRENIITGNKAAHEGDVITDADLYNPKESNTRHDEEVLVALYGLTACQISQLGKCLPKFR